MSKVIKYLLLFSVGCYVLLAFYYFMDKPMGGGDEALFLTDLKLISSSGWQVAIEKGISLPYMLLSYPLTLVIEPFLALRIVNILLFAGLLLYFYKRQRIRQWYFYAMLLFFYSTVGYFLVGTNDTLFVVSLVIFLVETYSILATPQKSSLAWWGCSLVIAFFTRELILVFAPVILLSIFFILKNKKANFKSLLFPAVVSVVFVLLNLPSIANEGRISYDQKLPPSTTTATWVQRQYHAQLLVNAEKIPNYSHPNWNETQAYLDANGSESLPSSISEAILFDSKMTIKEFFKDFAFISIYGSRQLGLTLVLVLFFLMRQLLVKRSLSASLFLPLSLLIIICVFALIIISFVELRWLAAVFIAAIFYFYRLEREEKISKFLVNANFLVIGLLSWYGMYGMITKL